MMRTAWGLGGGQCRTKRLYRFGYWSSEQRRPAPKRLRPGESCAENSPTPALLISCDAQRHRTLVSPWRRAVLSATRIMLFPGQHTRVLEPTKSVYLSQVFQAAFWII